MDAINVERLRDALKSLDRPTQISLARQICVPRSDIEDVAYGADPDDTLSPNGYTSLVTWFEDTTLRKLLSHPHIMDRIKDVSAIEGMTHDRVTAFIDKRVELTASEKDDLMAFARGGYSLTSSGKWLPPSKAPNPISAMNTSASLPKGIARRGAALNTINMLSTDDLEKLAKQVVPVTAAIAGAKLK